MSGPQATPAGRGAGAAELLITANSPGEVATWVSPVVAELAKRPQPPNISVWVPPCTFAAGTESAVLSSLPAVQRVYRPEDVKRLAYWGRLPEGFRPGGRGAVLFLGGDQAYAAFMARRLGYPAFAYTEGRAKWSRTYRRYFVPHEYAAAKARKSAKADQVEIVGDLMIDAVEPRLGRAAARKRYGADGSAPLVALFPGSRPFELIHMLPYWLKVADLIAAGDPVRFVMALSPFVTPEHVEAALAHGAGSVQKIAGCTATCRPWPGGDGLLLETPGGQAVPAVWGEAYDVMAAADLALTVPGSNNVEMAALGLPMIVALPLNFAEEIPLDGPAGLIGGLPLVGAKLKKGAVLKAAAKLPYFALCNRQAGRELTPEVRGVLQPEDVVIPALDLLGNPARRRKIAQALKAEFAVGGAAARIGAHVCEALEGGRSS
ncbi:MAG TPA: hypothetical protein VFK80_04485 [Limnochordia bacterium]|nr:hypothetical protein [Limnochordia bacterium]